MSKKQRFFSSISRSGFVRSIFTRVLSIFIIVSLAIAGIVFYSFASEIQKNILSARRRQLSVLDDTISERMEEISSIAYNISNDKAFYLEPLDGDVSSSYEMSATLARYLVGNSFIEHLAYYRIAEPDTIYISSGTRSLSEFFSSSFGLDKAGANAIIASIQSCTTTQVHFFNNGGDRASYFSYLYPLPQLSEKPLAYVLMLIPLKEVEPLSETLLNNSSGEVAVFDGSGTEIYRMCTFEESLPLEDFLDCREDEIVYKADNGTKYVVQKDVSDSNGWSYITAIRQSDTLSGLANKQLLFIVLLMLLMLLAVFALLVSIITQYKPISALAETVADSAEKDGRTGEVIDERVLLSNTIASLKGDSEKKQQFETAYHEAEAANKAKSIFLSNMSHDIRTPMNAIVGMTAIALKHADDPEYVRDCLGKVQSSSRYLLDIINNVLDMSRIESGRFTLAQESVVLPVLIDGLVSLTEPSIQAKGQHLNVEIDTLENQTVIGDTVRLTQIFINILNNSVKFTPEGGTVTLKVRQEPSGDADIGRYVFVFSDTGIGMPPEFVGQVFDTFSRANRADISKIEGTGLGMAIVKNLVDLMGGTIVCESELGKGTSFTIALPLKVVGAENAPLYAKSDKSRHSAESAAVPELYGRRILLVEDNTINREIARAILDETRAEVTEAVDGREAVNVFAGHPEGYFDMILMDLQMPVMNGYEATAEIRRMNRTDAAVVPIYAMTANTFDEDVRQVRDAGMNGHIGKPYTPDILYKALTQALRK